jgi:hypothetical protein
MEPVPIRVDVGLAGHSRCSKDVIGATTFQADVVRQRREIGGYVVSAEQMSEVELVAGGGVEAADGISATCGEKADCILSALRDIDPPLPMVTRSLLDVATTLEHSQGD